MAPHKKAPFLFSAVTNTFVAQKASMKKFLTVAVILATCAFSNPPKELQLHYVFKKGETFEWSQTSAVTQHIVVAGQDQNVETGVKATMLMKTIEVKAGTAKFEIEYSSIVMKMKTQLGDMSMDSEGDTTKVFNKIMAALKGKKFNFTLTKNGVVESVDNTENLWSGLTKLSQDPHVAQMKAQIEKSFGKASFKRNIESGFVYYPEQKLQAGSTWKHASDIGMDLPLKIANNWTLESVTEPTAVIVSDGEIVTTDSTKVIPMFGQFKATANLKGRQVTKSTISTTTGWPQTCKSYSELKGKMTLLAGGQIPEDMAMQMETTTETESTIKKK